MDIGFYEDLIKEGVSHIKHDGKDFYMLTPSALNGSIASIMSNADLDQNEKVCRTLAMILCDAEGKLIFDVNNSDHLAKIKAIPDKYVVVLVEAMTQALFPSKKK
jgi:hypothetical protein